MSEDIAIVGMSGRFPGAPDVTTFWRNVCDGVDAVHDYTDDELRAAGIGDALLADPTLIRAHGRLDDLAGFDAEFFGIADREAALLDPQHRLFLEQSWLALVDAGADPARVPGPIGVFSSCSANRYFLFHLLGNPAVQTGDPDDWEARLSGGATADHLPTRVAYRLGLTGPAVATQAACAGSLVAVCLAAQSLADYRCDVAVAGGVAVTAPRYRYAPGGLFSPDGRCRAFDAAAQGSGLSSGVGVLVLKRLDDAHADHDRIYAVLRGWAVTNDGALRAGYLAPGVAGQRAAVAEALASAELPASSIGYVQAHGSGTLVGDAIEVAALTAAFNTEQHGFCALSSVKTNVGNLDAAGGVAGLIAAVGAVRDGIIPGHLHFDQPNPEIDFAGSPFWVPTKTQPWPARAWPRRAGVNSFGQGGTNVHIIVEEPPADLRPSPAPDWYPLTLSARDPQALAAVVQSIRSYLEEVGSKIRLDDLAYTLNQRRAPFATRSAIVCADLAGARSALQRLADRGLAAAGLVELAGTDAAGTPAAASAATWVTGADVDWPAIMPGTSARVVTLPGHPFRRRRFWIDPPAREAAR